MKIFLIPIGVGVTTVLILWVVNRFKQPIITHFKKRKSRKNIREWKKAAEKRGAQPDYKTSEEILVEAIREYQETGECTTIPKETLEMLLLMGKISPAIPPTKSNNM